MDPASLTLRAWYELHFVVLFHADARRRTIDEYAATINHWERLTCNKPLAAISAMDLAQFRSALAERLAVPTVNKNLRHLNHLLAKAGPPGPHNRDALNLLPMAAWAKQLRTFQRRPRAAGLSAIGAFYRVCTDPWWRAFVVCAFHLGSRVTALIHVRDADVDWGRRLITLRAEHDKRRCERVKPMSAAVVRHLIELRGCGLLQWPRSKTAFYYAWHRLERLAGFADDDRFTPHALKRACGTQLARAGVSPWAVRYMLDHAQRDVTGSHYIDPLDELRSVVDLLPDPSRKVLSCPNVEEEKQL